VGIAMNYLLRLTPFSVEDSRHGSSSDSFQKAKLRPLWLLSRSQMFADTEHALSVQLNTPERIYQANVDIKKFHQEVARVVLVDAQNRCITKVDISRGTVNQSLAHPREIFRPVIM
jgi:DNA repair protein RadC